jgi:hypothetical protein
MAVINTLQLAACKNLIQMSSDVINYNGNCHSGLSNNLPRLFCFSIPEKQRVQKQAWHNSRINASNY